MFYIILLSVFLAVFFGLFGLWLFIWAFTMSDVPEFSEKPVPARSRLPATVRFK